MGKLLIGSFTARFDKSGRIKIPEKFRTAIEEQYGKELFITSLTDDAVHIYPLPTWEKLAGITKKGFRQFKPDVKMFLLRVNLKGSHYEIDPKGRVLISQTLREKAQLDGEVEIIGLNDHLELWNKDKVEQILEQHPLSDDDFERIAQLVDKET